MSAILQATAAISSKNRNAGGGGYVGTLTTGLVSSYINTGTDQVGSNDFTPVNSPFSTSIGKVNANCMGFAKSSFQMFRLLDASAANFEPNQTMSIAAWIRTTANFSFLGVYGKGSSTQMRTYTDSGGNIVTQHGGATVTGSAKITAGTFHHLVVTYDNSTHTVEQFVDGVSSGTATGSGASANVNNMHIGLAEATNYWNGRIDQFSLWHKILSGSEVSELWGGGSGIDFLAT